MTRTQILIGAEPNFNLIRSVDRANRFVQKNLLEGAGEAGPYGSILGPARHSPHANPFYKALSNVTIYAINVSELSGKPDGKYPEKLYQKETRSCQSGNQIWMKFGPDTTPESFEFHLVHEFVHAHDDPVYKKYEFNNYCEAKACRGVFSSLYQCFRAAKRNARGSNPASLSLDYVRFFFSRLKLLSEVAISVQEEALALKIVKEGRARLFSLLYMSQAEPAKAFQKAEESANNLVLAGVLGLPKSAYDMGLGFMQNLSEIMGLENAMLLTLFSPPSRLSEIENPEKYAKTAKVPAAKAHQYPF